MSTCADCKYYAEDADLAARVPPNHPRRDLMVRGSCHRYPPNDPRGRESRGALVSSSYWCGEWVSKS